MLAIIRTRWHTRPLSRPAKRRSSAAPGSLRKKYGGISIPQTWGTPLATLPHLEITGIRYNLMRFTAPRLPTAVDAHDSRRFICHDDCGGGGQYTAEAMAHC